MPRCSAWRFWWGPGRERSRSSNSAGRRSGGACWSSDSSARSCSAGPRTGQRGPDLCEVVLVVGRHLIELVLQGAQAGRAVHEFAVPVSLILRADVMDDGRPGRLVEASRHIQRQVAVVETPGPRVLIVHPDHLPGSLTTRRMRYRNTVSL